MELIFFDCADAYSGGAAERFFGEVLKEFPRKDLVISSKVYFPTGDGVMIEDFPESTLWKTVSSL